jgi:hypothetical protein
MPEQAAEKLNSLRKINHKGYIPHTFITTYAALKGRSSTGVPTFIRFSAACEGMP